MEFKSINAEQGIDRVGNRINRIIMEFKCVIDNAAVINRMFELIES